MNKIFLFLFIGMILISSIDGEQSIIEKQNQTIQIYEQRFKELCSQNKNYSWC